MGVQGELHPGHQEGSEAEVVRLLGGDWCRQVLETVLEGVFVMDAGLRLVFANGSLAALLGQTPAEVQGRRLPELLDDASVGEAGQLVEDWRRGVSGQHDLGLRRKDGSTLWALVSVRPFLDPGGVFVGAVGTVTDVTGRRRAEQLLAESEERYRKLVELSPDGIAVHAGGRLLFVNPAAARMLGAASPEDLVGRPVMDFVHPDFRDIVRERVRRMTEVGATAPLIEERFLRLDGSSFDVEVTATRIQYENRPAVLVVVRDITDRKKAEAAIALERAYLSSAVEVFPIPVAFLSPDRTVLRANPAMYRFFGTEDTRRWWDIQFLHPDTRVQTPREDWEVWSALRGERLEAAERIVAFPDGREVPVLVHAAPVLVDGEVVAAVVAIQDITPLKESDRAKDEFLSTLSHELKTPLSSILGWSEAVQRRPALTERGLQAIERNARRLRGTVEDLVDVSLLVHGRMRLSLEVLDAWEVAREAAELVREAAARRGLALVLLAPPAPLPVLGDRGRLLQVVGNLLSNALKFTDPGGTVTVAGRMEEGQAVVEVRDTGRGVPPEVLPTLFRPFRQVQRTETTGGLGLGLALVKGIVTLHGGSVTASSPGPGKGATFTVRLPLRQGAEGPSPPLPVRTPSPS